MLTPLSPAPLPRDFGRSSVSGCILGRGPISIPIIALILFCPLASQAGSPPAELGGGR